MKPHQLKSLEQKARTRELPSSKPTPCTAGKLAAKTKKTS